MKKFEFSKIFLSLFEQHLKETACKVIVKKSVHFFHGMSIASFENSTMFKSKFSSQINQSKEVFAGCVCTLVISEYL